LAEAVAVARFDVLGVPVSALRLGQAVQTIATWIRERTPGYVCVTGVHGVMESQRDRELLRIHRDAGLVTPDGMPLVWVGRLSGRHDVERVYGPDLMLAMCRASVAAGYRHFFYGGAPGVADTLARRLSARFPGLVVAGAHPPPYRELTVEEDEALVRQINDARADIVWVGLSTPKQER